MINFPKFVRIVIWRIKYDRIIILSPVIHWGMD